jgi:adenylate cyclase
MADRYLTPSTSSATTVPEWIAASPGGLLRTPGLAGTLRLVKPAADPCLPLAGPRERRVDEPSSEVVREALARLLASGDFDGTPRSRDFLRFIVEETLDGRQDELTQATVATRVFGRRQDFDATIDPIVRIQAGRLRRSLERYYLLSGTRDPVRIELPRGGYVPNVSWALRQEPSGAGESACSRSGDEWPSVIVGPFESCGTDPRVDEGTLARFCERISVELGRFGDVRILLRSELDKLGETSREGSGFALSGHLSFDATGGRALARLVDCRNARQIWAEEFRCGPGRKAGFQDEAARMIAVRVASERGAVARRLWAEHRRRPFAEPTSYDAILRSYRFLFDRQPGDLVAALERLQRAVEAEPECGLAWVQLARLCADNWVSELASVETPVELAVRAARNGVHLDPFSQTARVALAQSLFVKGDLAAARGEAAKALDLDPGSFAQLDSVGWLMTLLGDRKRGPALVREGMARNPSHSSLVFQALWADHLWRGEIEQSERAALQYHDPASFWPSLMRACSLGHLGKVADAKVVLAGLLARKPDFPSRGLALIGRLIKLPGLFERVVGGLAKAGLVLR